MGSMLDVTPAKAGMHLIGWLPDGVSDREVSRRAAEEGLTLAPVSTYCINQNLRGGLLLGYTAYDEKTYQARHEEVSASANRNRPGLKRSQSLVETTATS